VKRVIIIQNMDEKVLNAFGEDMPAKKTYDNCKISGGVKR